MGIPPLRALRAVIFDLDGVIIDSERARFRLINQLLKPYRLRVRRRDFPALAGERTGHYLKRKFGRQLSDAEIAELCRARRQHKLRHLRIHGKPITGVRAFVRLLRRRKLRLGIATGESRQVTARVLRRIGLRSAFAVLVTGEDCPPSKPSPAIYRLALRRMHVPAGQALVIEDAINGIIAAKRAGIPVVGIATTFPRRMLKCADLVVGSFKELQRKLR